MFSRTNFRLIPLVVAVMLFNKVEASCPQRAFNGVVVASNSDSHSADLSMFTVARVINDLRQEELEFNLTVYGRDGASVNFVNLKKTLIGSDLQPSGDATTPRSLEDILEKIADDFEEETQPPNVVRFVIIVVDERDDFESLNDTFDVGLRLRDLGVPVFPVSTNFGNLTMQRAAAAAAARNILRTSFLVSSGDFKNLPRVASMLKSLSFNITTNCFTGEEKYFTISSPASHDDCFASDPPISYDDPHLPREPRGSMGCHPSYKVENNMNLAISGTSCGRELVLDHTKQEILRLMVKARRKGESEASFWAECVPKNGGSIFDAME